MAHTKIVSPSNGTINNVKNRAKVALDEMEKNGEGIKTRKGRKPLTDDEKTPSGRFYRVMGVRAGKVCEMLTLMAQGVDPEVYFGTEAQKLAILNIIDKKVAKLRKAWTTPVEAVKVIKSKNILDDIEV